MSSNSFARLATLTASTKRSPAIAGGKRGEPALHVPALACTPLDPVSAQTAQRIGLETPHTLLETYADGALLDVRASDVLVVGAREYPIRFVGDWEFRGGKYLHLVLEDLQR